jgi:tetratricopeptide (TPR) repeat protein
MLDCQLFGPNPGWMHIVNVLLHIANALLLFAVLKKMTGALWASAFVAAAFALHPMHVESVAWIAERKDVLSTFFLLLTLAAYVGYVKRPSVFRYLITLAIFALGLMAKPMLVTLPFVLLLLDYWPLNRFEPQPRKPAPIGETHASPQRIMVEKIPFLVFAVAASAVTFLVQRSSRAVKDIAMEYRAVNALTSYVEYISKLFLPRNLAVFYPFDAGSFAMWQVAMSILLLLVISILVIRLRHRRKYLPVGWFWFVGTLVPVIGFIHVGGQAYADRYTYIPYIGLFIMLAWGLPELLSKWAYRKIALGIAAAIALTAMGICAHGQVNYWNNSITLFTHATLVTQNNYIAHYNRGVAYCKLGRELEAIEDFSQTIKVDPEHAKARYSRGVAYDKLGRKLEAIEDFGQALRIDPHYAKAHNNRGVVYRKLGRRDEAMEDFRQAIKIDPDLAEAHYDLANGLAGQGNYDEAASQYHEALKLKSDWPDCMSNLALLIATKPEIKDRDTSEAIRLAGGACKLTNYKDPAYLGTLAAAQASAGRFSEAVDTANKALSLADAANQPQLKNTIGRHLSLYKQGKDCIEPSPKPLADPNKP